MSGGIECFGCGTNRHHSKILYHEYRSHEVPICTDDEDCVQISENNLDFQFMEEE